MGLMAPVVALSFTLAAGAAQAATLKAKAELVCTAKPDAQAEPLTLPSWKLKRLATPVTCSVRVLDGPQDGKGYNVVLSTSRKVTDPETSKTSTVVGPEHRAAGVAVGADAAPFSTQLLRVDDKGAGDYASCKDFTVLAEVKTDAAETRWTKKITVHQTCPAPAKVKLTLTCTTTGAEGQALTLPDAKKSRLSKANIECKLESPGQTLGASHVESRTTWTTGTGVTKETHKSGPTPIVVRTVAPSVPDGSQPPPSAYTSVGAFSLAPKTAFDVCAPSTDLKLRVTDEDGRLMTEKKVSFKQSCPKPKPLKAKLLCSMKYGEGEPEIKLPSLKYPRFSPHGIDCSVVSNDERLGKATVTYQTAWDAPDASGTKVKKGSPARPVGTVMAEGETYVRQFKLQEAQGDYEECSAPMDLKVKAVNADGDSLFETAVRIKQRCDD